VAKPVVLRVAVPGKLDELLVGRAFAGAARRAHFALFGLSDDAGEGGPLELVVAPMLAGRFLIARAEDKSPADLAVAWRLADGRELRYRDDVQMGKVYVVARDGWDQVPGLARVGIDVLSRAFTRDAFRKLARGRRDQVRVFLMDKSAIDALGNAYADEVLFAAGIHPKTLTAKLSPDDLDRLHDAVVSVLREAAAAIAARKPPLDEKLRDFLKVRNRHGEKCPRCGGTIRRAGVRGFDAFFCPTCQPATRKTGIVDWRKV
jgi:formamidopyrimidine-DNA glycosylase